MNVVDLSNRRGAIVHLLPQVYEVLKGEQSSILNIVLWTHEMNKSLVDIHKKWVFALNGTKDMLGMMFYRLGVENDIYIDLLSAKKGAVNSLVIEALIKKFEQDNEVKSRQSFYVGRQVKREASDEILGTVGLQDETVFNDDGYQLLGSYDQAIKALKLRYLR